MHLLVFLPESAVITPGNVLFPGSPGSIPFQLPRIHAVVKEGETSGFSDRVETVLALNTGGPDFQKPCRKASDRRSLCGRQKMMFHVTASAERLYRDIGVEKLEPCIWSGLNHHDISSLCPPTDCRSRGGGTVLKDALRPVPVGNCWE